MSKLNLEMESLLIELRGIEASATLLKTRCYRARKELERMRSAKAPSKKTGKEAMTASEELRLTRFLESRNKRIKNYIK